MILLSATGAITEKHHISKNDVYDFQEHNNRVKGYFLSLLHLKEN